MKDLDIINDYKQPSDEEIEKSQNFSELLASYNTTHKGKPKSRIKLLGGTLFLFSVIAILSYFILNRSDNHENADGEIKPRESVVPVVKDSVFEKKVLVQARDTLKKSVQERTISLKEKPSKVKYSSAETTTHPGIKDSVHKTSTESLFDKPLKTDSVIEPAKNKVKVKNGNQIIYEQDQQELEKKLLERYYQKKK
ncbi:MAG: hypothetical protein NVV82_04680 [Sporocytophaga sp.]|nr:hypothetical protein [Sporocytophaga sp.]